MSSLERDRKELQSVAAAWLSSPPRALESASTAGSATETTPSPLETADSGAERPCVQVVTAVACGAPANAPDFALALAALPSPATRTLVFALDAAGADWVLPLGADADRLEALEQGGGRALVMVPPRDGPGARALALAAAAHLLWLGPKPDAVDQAVAFLGALEAGCDGANLGWLTAPAGEAASFDAAVRAWAAKGADRTAAALGMWAPGLPLPGLVCGFLAQHGAGRLGSLSWARGLLRRIEDGR